MKIEKVVRDLKKYGTVGDRIYSYLKKHPEEVYTYYDKDLTNAFPEFNINSINWTLWNLARKKKIGKLKISDVSKGRPRAYFGCHEAIKHLQEELDTQR